MEQIKEKTCCFFGHRKIKNTEEIKTAVYKNAERLVTEENTSTFLFGSKSQFDDLCYEIISDLKKKYPHIKRVYVRAEFPHIDEDYTNYLLQFYEESYYPEKMINAGRASYVERNYEMINKSDFCIIYFDENYKPPMRKNSKRDLTAYQPKSGTKIAYDYAQRQGIEIINIFSR